jgi:hypothetical protein
MKGMFHRKTKVGKGSTSKFFNICKDYQEARKTLPMNG